jgi:hypothetical protein
MTDKIFYEVRLQIQDKPGLIEEKTFWISRNIKDPDLSINGIALYIAQIEREVRRNKLYKRHSIRYEFYERTNLIDKVHTFDSHHRDLMLRLISNCKEKYYLTFTNTTDNFKPKRIAGKKIK